MARKEDLEHSIYQSYDIIRQYEDMIRTSDRPEEKARARRVIDEQWALVQGYLAEYRGIAGEKLPDEIAQIAAHFEVLVKWSEAEKGIAAQEALRGILSDEQVEKTVADLRNAQVSILATLEGSGAIAQDHSVAAGKGGIAVGRDVHGDVIASGGKKEVHQYGSPGPDPVPLRRQYLRSLLERTGHLALSGIDPRTASDAEARLELSAVYTALLTLTPAESEQLQNHGYLEPVKNPAASGEGSSKEKAFSGFFHQERQARRLSALAQLDGHDRLVLLGDPGSGKSTFVRFVAACLAGEALGRKDANVALLTEPLPQQDGDKEKESEPQPWSHGALLPVRVELRNLAARGLPPPEQEATAKHLCEYVAAQLDAVRLGEYMPHLERELREEGGLLLLDGLDEVPAANRRREQIRQMVTSLVEAFPKCRILVTSRTYAYQQQAWRLPGFDEAVLAPFGQGQIHRFVDRWYAHIATLRDMPPEDATHRAGLLKGAIDNSDRLRELAERPLLLTLMASLHAWRGGSLPEKREELYADTVDLLLDWWEEAKSKEGVRQPSLSEWLKVDRDRVRELLNELAYKVHGTQLDLVGTADVPEGDLLSGLMRISRNRDVRIGLLQDYLSQRAGLLLPRGVEVYTFPHRTFQEYLAACHLTDHEYPDRVADLAREEPDRWREVALLAGAKAARGTAAAIWLLSDALCYHDPPPAGSEEEANDEDTWGAALAGQALVESANLDRVSGRNALRRDRVRGWLRAIVARGWLPPTDRMVAGEALAVLGDDRDLEALVVVPGGPFVMGDDEDSEARPAHEVTVPAFKIAKYMVTNAQYRRFVEATGRRWRSPDADQPQKANCPARYVSWHDARAYCAWLTGVWREEGRIAGDEVVRLPTEAEWEKAARGDKDERRYPWGDEWDETRCNTSESGLGDTCVVGMYPSGASLYCCLDMAGNVWEWCQSLYKAYPYNPDDGREELDRSGSRVVRGGSWNLYQLNARCAFRDSYYPEFEWDYHGFRVVVSPISQLSSLPAPTARVSALCALIGAEGADSALL